LEGGSAHRKTSTCTVHNKTEGFGHTSMLRVGIKLTIHVFERSKIARALDRGDCDWSSLLHRKQIMTKVVKEPELCAVLWIVNIHIRFPYLCMETNDV
jgi:hypothetical protein